MLCAPPLGQDAGRPDRELLVRHARPINELVHDQSPDAQLDLGLGAVAHRHRHIIQEGQLLPRHFILNIRERVRRRPDLVRLVGHVVVELEVHEELEESHINVVVLLRS